MSDAQKGLAAIYACFSVMILWSPSFSCALAMAITGFMYLVTGDEKTEDVSTDHAALLLEAAKLRTDIDDLKGRVGQLSLAQGFKNLKKD